MVLHISPADFSNADLVSFLSAHLDEMAPTAPAESRHALDVDALRAPGVRLWVAHDDGVLVGTVALASAGPGHEELKSMRADPTRRGAGIGRALLQFAVSDARKRGIRRLSLETGSMDFFAPARSLYRTAGFVECAPFGAYKPDPNSVFMTLEVETQTP